MRLKDYDYSKPGLYFVTICTQDREHLFGKIINEPAVANLSVCHLENKIMKLNIAGEMIQDWIIELPNKFENIKCDYYIIMPNHLHMIIEIFEPRHEHIGSSLPTIIQWFKTMTTNEYIRMVKRDILPSFNKRVWQRNYYEQIIRNETQYINTINYIKYNPLK